MYTSFFDYTLFMPFYVVIFKSGSFDPLSDNNESSVLDMIRTHRKRDEFVSVRGVHPCIVHGQPLDIGVKIIKLGFVVRIKELIILENVSLALLIDLA